MLDDSTSYLESLTKQPNIWQASHIRSCYVLNVLKYVDTYPKQQKYQDNLVMLMTKLFTTMSLVQGYALQMFLSNLEPSIQQLSWYFLQRKLILEKAELSELRVKNFINKCVAVVLTHNLWMPQTNKQKIFSMTAHHF